jgi:predicted outer membrane repeat protein
MLHRTVAVPLAALLASVLHNSEAARRHRRRNLQQRHEQVQDEHKKKKGQVSPPPPSPPCTVCAVGCAFSSVQAAINEASAGATVSLCAGIYEGNVTIDRDVTLVGAGQGGVGQTRLEGAGSGRVVAIAPGRTVTLRNLRITGGAVDVGTGIFNEGQLTLIDCSITRNNADGNGGGIYNVGDGTLALAGCTISANTSTGGGGGIFSVGTCTIVTSSITGNTGSSGGGLYNDNSLYFDAALMTLTNTTVSGNSADYGGGIDSLSTLTLNAGTVERNTARVQGGGLDNWSGTATLSGSIKGNRALEPGPSGGGI